jgi:hypothetical protein
LPARNTELLLILLLLLLLLLEARLAQCSIECQVLWGMWHVAPQTLQTPKPQQQQQPGQGPRQLPPR